MAETTQHLDLIAEMSRDFALSRDIEATLRHGLAAIAEAVGAEASSLFLLDEDSGELVCHACTGPVDITGLRLPPGRGIVGCTVAEDRARMVRDVRQDADFGAMVDAQTGFVTRSIMCAPMSVQGHRLGAIELLNKKGGGLFDTGDRQLLQTLASSAALALLNARLTSAMVEQEGMRREMALAAEIQRGMLPPPSSGEAPIHGVNLPAGSVSGDFFDIMALPGGDVAFCIGDVSGKGMNAALLMARTSSLFRCLAKTAPGPGRLLAAINDELCETGGGGMFVTMAAGLYDPAARRVRLASAGHEPALLHRDGGFTAFPAQAPPLGIAPDMIEGAVGEDEIALGGGALYLFTDGLTEAAGADGGMLGAAGVRRLIESLVGLAPGRRLAAIVDTAAPAGAPRRDDLTLLVVQGGAS